MRKRSNGKIEVHHSIGSRDAIRSVSLWLAAAAVAPGHNMAVPLMPVPGLDPGISVKPDGSEKQDCERNAARRWLGG